ncbi:MAG: hypothetical protein PVJ27_04680 [Candidatus Brocadiaceae bacterium]
MKKTGLLCAVALAWVAGAAMARPRTAELPDTVVAAVEVRQMASLGPRLQELALQIHPNLAMPSLSAGMAMGWLHTMNPGSVDMAQPLRLLRMAPPAHHASVLVFSVTDPALYLDSLTLTRAEGEDREGLLAYRESGLPYAPSPQGGQPGRLLFLATVGQQVVMGQAAAAVKAARDLVQEGRLPAEPIFEEDLGAVLRLQDLLSGLKETGADPFEELRRQALAATPPRAGRRRNVEASMDMLEDLAGQLDTLSGQLSLTGDAIVATSWLEPVADTGLDRYARSITPGEFRLLEYMPVDSMFALGLRMGDLSPLGEWWARWVRELLPPEGADDETVQKMVRSFGQWSEIMGDEMALAVSSTERGPLFLAEAVKLSDPAGARELMGQMPEQLPRLAKLQTTPLMRTTTEFTSGYATHAGSTISEWRFRWEIQEEGLNAAQQRAAAAQKASLDAVYGEELLMYSAIVGSDFLVTAGPGALDALKRAIDGTTPSVAGSEKLSGALTDAPPEPVAMGVLSLGEVANWYVRLFRRVLQESGMPLTMPLFQFRGGEPVGMAAYVRDQNVLEHRVRVPVDAMGAVVEPFLGPPVPQQSGSSAP